MNKTSIIIVAIVALAIVTAFFIWQSHNRYYIISGTEGSAYEVDRKTGESWLLYGGRKIAQEGSGERNKKEVELPPLDAAKITGNAGLYDGSFSGRIYNGSDWVVTKVIVNVSAKEEDGTVRWSHDFSAVLTINPLTTESFSVLVSGSHGAKNGGWNIARVFGYKE